MDSLKRCWLLTPLEDLHPGRFTWNLRIIFQTIIFRFYVYLPGCNGWFHIKNQRFFFCKGKWSSEPNLHDDGNMWIFRGVIKGLLDVGWISWNSVDIWDHPTTYLREWVRRGWGVSTWWILCVKQQQFEMGNLNKWVCHRWLYITIIIPLKIKVWQIYSYPETPSTKCRHLKNYPTNHPENDAHSKNLRVAVLSIQFQQKKSTNKPTRSIQSVGLSGTPRTWDPLLVALGPHTIPIPLPCLNP